MTVPSIAELPPLEIGEFTGENLAVSKWVLYGPSGTGKTYMAGTFPAPVFLDLEGGMASLLPLLEEGRKILRVPQRGPIISFSDFLDCLSLLERTLATSPSTFQTVVVDSVNHLQYLMAQEILISFDRSRDYDDQLTRSDYGKLARLLEGAVIRLFSLPCNVVLLIGTQQQAPDETIWPSLVGSKSVPMLLRLADAVGYCFTQYVSEPGTEEHQQFFVSFSSCDRWVAKFRGTQLPFRLPNVYPL